MDKNMQRPTDASTRTARPAAALILLAALALGACGGGAENTTNVAPQEDGDANAYNGPDPASDDVQAFRINVWENLRSSSRCGACHGAGGQSPTFVNEDNVNAAYSAANSVVDLEDPAESLMVTKVAGGHNCWQESDQACADIIENYIAAWAGGSAGGTNQVELEPPGSLRGPGESLSFPDSSQFRATVYPLVEEYCSDCHRAGAAVPQQPYFASEDLATAYEAAKGKMNLDNPGQSRLVARLDEGHNCWDDCSSNADTMQAAIEDLADVAPTSSVDEQLLHSAALGMDDGLVASGGGRYEGNVIAKYTFSTGEGTTAYDTSGVDPAMNLTLTSANNWVGGNGIRFDDDMTKAQASTSASTKLSERIKLTGEYAIEAWVVPGNVAQEGPARIVSYSGGNNIRNFTLGQTLYNYDFLNRSENTDANGEPALSTPNGEEVLQATLQHVVVNYSPVAGRTIYVNGEVVAENDPAAGGSVESWDETFALVLGNEVSGDYPWEGTIRLLAIYDRTLDQAQIDQNFEAGVGERFFLLFHVGCILVDGTEGTDCDDSSPAYDSYILFEVSRFDSYSYLFDRPRFVNLNESWEPDGIALEGLRLGINGREAQVGQAYVNVEASLNAEDYAYENQGQQLSRLGTIIPLEQGPASDEFFLTFDRLGSAEGVRSEPAAPTPAAPSDGEPRPAIGVRTFDEVNATMAQVTGIPRDNVAVRDTYSRVKQQLPTGENPQGFSSSQQMAVSQLAIEYCNALVEDPTARQDFFGSFGFGQDVGTAFGSYSGDTAEKQQIVDALYDNIVGDNLDTAPARSALYTELADPANSTNLFRRLTESCANSCDAERTRTVVKAMCATTLSSAAVLVH